MHEARGLLSFFYEEATAITERRAMENTGAFVSRTQTPQGWSGTALVLQSRLPGGHTVGSADGSAMAGSARGISGRFDLLAPVAELGRAGRMAEGMAKTVVDAGPAPIAGLGGGLPGRYLHHCQKGGSAVGKTRRGKGTECMVVVDGNGIPIGAQLASAQLAECRLAESTIAQVKVPRKGRGRPRSHLNRVIADRGYDSDALRMRFHKRHTELIVPYRKNVRNRRFEDKRKLRRYRRRWKIERTNAWLQNFRRIQVRFDRILTVFQGFFHCACIIIALRHLCNQF
jgi:transposase